VYGKNRISLTKRAAHRHGWQEVTCTVYGKGVVKQVKTFLATHRTFGGAIRVVIVQEKTGPQFFFCTDVNASVKEIVETFADRSAIEQVFHDVKEVWGSGQQQVRNLWTNIAVWHMNLWLYTLVELWAWERSSEELVHREDSPWDDASRRPSHADRRNSLQAACLEEEFSQRVPQGQMKQKFQTLLQRLLRITLAC
jgi:Transposase DDE domain